MNTERDDQRDDRELLDLLGEPARDAEGGDAPAAGWAEYASLLGELRAADDARGPSDQFSASLRRAWEAETHALHTSARTRGRGWWGLSLPLAAAAVIAFVLLWPGGVVDDGRGGSGVAWADVVRAMDRVPQFHMIVFSDDPRRADETMRMFRIDLFYQQPDRWRAHGMGHVGFAAGGERKTWSVQKRQLVQKGERAPDMFPSAFVEEHRKSGILSAVLSSVFGGKVPAGVPVKSDEVSAAQGIDVFDYAQNASEKWARIWVLRESKLPLKMHLYYPGSDEFTLVTFDYSDPQPNEFFDAESFLKQASKLTDADAYRYYSIGSTPVAGTRPRGADQIHAVEGGYKAPTVKRVLSNDAGDVAVITDRVEHRTPGGHSPHESGYQRVTDSWGNEFLLATEASAGRDEYRRVLMPHPPFKTGTGPRQLTMTYVVEPQHGQRVELVTETIAVPDPSVQGKPGDWPQDLEQGKRFAWRNYLGHYGTLAQQLEAIETALAADPKDADALTWKFKLLREHGREDAAWGLFEAQLRDRVFGDPKLLNDHYVPAAEYLLYLAHQGRAEELRRLSDVAKKAMEAARGLKGKRPSPGSTRLYNLERVEHNPLYPAAHVLEWREAYKDGPQVVRTVAGRDGLVFVELAVPKPPEGWSSNGWDGEAPFGWFWQPTFGDGWEMQARLPKTEEGRLRLVARGTGKRLSLAGAATLALDNYGSKPTRRDAKVEWRRMVDVPEPSIDDMNGWWLTANGNDDKGWRPLGAASTQPATQPASGPADWKHQADQLRDAGKHDEALTLYAKAIAAPKEQWPEMYTKGVALLPDTVEQIRRTMRVSQAQCLAELGRLDESRKIAATLRAELPEKPDLADPTQGHLAADALAAELHVPRAMLKQGDVKAAAAELERLAARRPKLTDLPDGTIMVDRGPVKYGWHPRSKQEEAWRQYDALWWEVKDALSQPAATRPTTAAAAA